MVQPQSSTLFGDGSNTGGCTAGIMGAGWYEFLTETERINWKIVSLEQLMMQAEVIAKLGR